MPATLLQPGVYIEEIPSGVRTITGVATSIAMFIGWAPRGPVDRALRITSFADFQRAYGGLDRRSLLGYSVKQFFDNGGADAYVIRIASTDAADPAKTAACDLGDLHIPASSPGEWAHAFSVRLTRRTDEASRFRLEVIMPANNDAVVESFENLSMTDTDPRFAPAVINGRSVFMDGISAKSA
ncbi:MAG: phage tail sheath family protein, partial [Rhodoplanes sp.]